MRCDPDVRKAWLHSLHLEIQNLIKHETFIIGEIPRKDELIIPIKLIFRAKQTANGDLEKCKARIVARGDMEKRRMKKRKNEVRLLNELQRQKDKLSRANAIDLPHMSTQPQVIDIPSPPEDTWSPCASSRGVKMFIATICSAHRQIKSADFIGAYLQAKVVGRHFVKLPIEYAYHFPQYAKYFGTPLLLHKGIYGFSFSGKYWKHRIF